MKRWPLAFISLPAAVAIWSGWVSLGQLCGFGLVTPLPGIVSWHLDTAITLPIGVEAYASYALAAWLTPGTPDRARLFAKRSAIGALGLGMSGQVIYHLLAAAHATKAPWPVTVLVACLPVVTLGFGVALAHLLRAPDTGSGSVGSTPGTFPGDPWTGSRVLPTVPLEALPEPPAESIHRSSRPRSPRPSPASAGSGKLPGPATVERLREHYAGELAAGNAPSIRQIKRDWPVGHATASGLREQMLSGINGHPGGSG